MCLCFVPFSLATDTRQKTVVTHGERAEVRRRQDTLKMEGEFMGREQRTSQTKVVQAAGVPSGAGRRPSVHRQPAHRYRVTASQSQANTASKVITAKNHNLRAQRIALDGQVTPASHRATP